MAGGGNKTGRRGEHGWLWWKQGAIFKKKSPNDDQRRLGSLYASVAAKQGLWR